MTLPPLTAPPTSKHRLRLPRDRQLTISGDPPLVMGVVNLTPDSFSDGGRWNQTETAVERALTLFEQGADLVDLGAESTRPGGGVYGGGAREIAADEEIERLLPVLEQLRSRTDRPISIDTRKARVADLALRAGADLINDVSALGELDLGLSVAEAGCPVVLMHSRGEISSMQRGIDFHDVVTEVRQELQTAVDRGIACGIPRSQILVDPGIGFGKTSAQNAVLLGALDELQTVAPVLVGASRKSFIGDLSGAAVDERLPGSLAAVAWAAQSGAAVVRVHDVEETVQFLKVWREIAHSGGAR